MANPISPTLNDGEQVGLPGRRELAWEGGVPGATLAVSPTTIVLSPLTDSSITLTASGGSVSWTISESGSLLGDLSVAPTSGALAVRRSGGYEGRLVD